MPSRIKARTEPTMGTEIDGEEPGAFQTRRTHDVPRDKPDQTKNTVILRSIVDLQAWEPE